MLCRYSKYGMYILFMLCMTRVNCIYVCADSYSTYIFNSAKANEDEPPAC